MVQISTLVREVLSRKSAGHNITTTKRWLAVFVVIIGILVYDLKYTGYGKGSVWWIGIILGLLYSLVILLKLLWRYLTQYLRLSPMEVTEKQRSLLSIIETDVGFKSSTPKKVSATSVPDKLVPLSSLFRASLRTPTAGSVTPMNMSAASWASPSPTTPTGVLTPLNMMSNVWGSTSLLRTPAAAAGLTPMNMSAASWASNTMPSPLSSTSGSPAMNFSQNSCSIGSVTANSWVYHSNQSSIGSPFTVSQGRNPMLSRSQMSDSSLNQMTCNTPAAKCGSPITNESELRSYLTAYKEKEKLRQIMSQAESNNSMNSSLWAYGSASHTQLSEYNSLRKNVYQVATKDIDQETNSADSKNDDSKASNLTTSSVSKIWRKRNVSPEELFQFTENLRVWMSATVLVPLVKGIDATNKTLGAVAPEIQIGSVGLDKLKKTAQNISGLKQLADIVPFLDVTVHQDYLVHRLRELSVGGAISAYKWNGGSASFNGKPWKEEYPTDTAILLHLFAMYMDRQLPPDILQPEGRMFSTTHIVKAPEKPNKPTSIPLLYFSQVNPPHLKVVLPPEEECEVGSGRNNFIHAMLLFIHHVTNQQHSRIANINLSMSGVNLSWVVRKS